MIFILSQLQEKCLQQNVDLYSVFIDVRKAFDKVNRNALWTIFWKPGCHLKFAILIQMFHNDIMGEVSQKENNISNDIKQSYIISPVLFNLFFAYVLPYAFRD